VTALLELKGVEARYGQVKALHGVSLAVGEGEVAAVLGANGAGKTTTLRAVSHTVRYSGEIRFAGRSLRRHCAESIAALGIAHVPEGRGLFPELTIVENLRLGAYTRRGSIKDDLDRVYSYFPWLGRRRHEQSGSLSGGEQQMVAIGRALMAHPKLLLLDEPSMGLAPIFVERIFEIIKEINSQGTPILLVEQNALMALDVANRGYVLETGKIALADDAKKLKENEDVKKTYLGAD